jgi:hypothetical protein
MLGNSSKGVLYRLGLGTLRTEVVLSVYRIIFQYYTIVGHCQFPGTTKKKVVGLERGPLSLVSTTEELLGRKVAAPV